MQKIESVVAGIPYENGPLKYSHEVVSEIEALTGKPFPEDFRWYLLNIGWQKIAFDYRKILVPNGEYIYALQFEGVEHQTFAIHRYKLHLEANPAEPLYYPFGKIEGEINPAVSFQLLISLEEGSVWACRKDKFKIADSFSQFLEQTGASDASAKKNNEALFSRLLENYQGVPPTTAAGPEQLFSLFLSNNQAVIDGVSNVVFLRHDVGLRIENEQQFKERVEVFTQMNNPSWLLGNILRRDMKVSAPELHNQPNYYLVTVDSIVGDKNQLKEKFLMHMQDAQWTMIRRYQATIDDVKIKGVGTFSFDSTYKWELKKKVTPSWSELKVNLHVDGEEDAMTASMIAYIQEVLNKADFRPVIEAYILKDAGTTAANIWSVLGNDAEIYIDSDHAFHFHADCPWDEEHGITVRVKDWEIQ
jgi:hypothetical protein